MGDERNKRGGEPPEHLSVPPELRRREGQAAVTKAQIRESGEVRAAFADIEGAIAEAARKAKEEQAKLGVGNVSAYHDPAPVPEPTRKDTLTHVPRVEVAVADAPRALPAGNPGLPTVEIDTRAVREQVSKGGGGAEQRSRSRMLVAVAVGVVGVVVMVRAMTSGRAPDDGSQGATTTAATMAVVPAVGAARPPAPPASVVATSAVPSGVATAVAPVAPSAVHAPTRPHVAPAAASTVDDPYDAAVKPIPPTAIPAATSSTPTAPSPPAATSSTKPPAPATTSEKPIYD